MKIKRKWLLFAVLLLMAVLVAGLIHYFLRPKAPKSLEGLLHVAFTLPDKELGSEEIKNRENGLNERIKAIVAPYCNEKNINAISGYYGYSMLPMLFISQPGEPAIDQSMQIKSCTITPQKGKENSYDWAVTVTYGPNGTETEMQFTGSARCDAEGKVEYWALSARSVKEAVDLYDALHSQT